MIDALTNICNKIWQTGEWPTCWTQSLVITLPKKRNLQKCQNYRTISLISHTNKVMLRILLNRLKPQAETIIVEEQAGFRAGRSTTEQIFNLRIICEKHLQHQQDLYHVFIDFKKAFDRVWHGASWATVRKYNISTNLIRVTEHLYDHATSAVLLNGTQTYGMEISAEKTKVMANNSNGIQRIIQVEGQKLETVDSFKYLGAIISDAGSKKEILARITQSTAGRVEANEMRCYRKILNISYKDHITNEEVRNRIYTVIGAPDSLLSIVKKRKMTWYGHVTRSNGLAKTILQGTVPGGIQRGRQKKRWEENIKEWTGLSFADSQREAHDRCRWREIVTKSSFVPLQPTQVLRD
ncbi:uncharacterized protein LOC125045958 [Penaeus chinensis]|uniref:uncharacterized protein LOC125045958 n=1 Tax=Penaeus chinensis TaxID=139456 RepID=UPI001FB850D6|nr:uncharacterized protein LOC125045958 [Penaeus chinensis]